MSGQLWGTCGWCEHRKRVTKASGILYRHTWEGSECEGSGAFPVLDSVRARDVVDVYTNPDIIANELPTASWGWDALYALLWLGALAAGFAAGWWWRGR